MNRLSCKYNRPVRMMLIIIVLALVGCLFQFSINSADHILPENSLYNASLENISIYNTIFHFYNSNEAQQKTIDLQQCTLLEFFAMIDVLILIALIFKRPKSFNDSLPAQLKLFLLLLPLQNTGRFKTVHL